MADRGAHHRTGKARRAAADHGRADGPELRLDLAREGILEAHGVEMIGATKEAIDKAEDRYLSTAR